jgi:hypothetical protein
MNQDKECEPLNVSNRSAWPAAVQAVTLFTPVGNAKTPPVVVHYLECAAFTALQITSIADTLFAVTDLTVNGEFQPAISIFADQFRFLRLPVSMLRGFSFGAVLQPPPSANMPVDCYYPKMPVSLVVFTDRGNFTFHASETTRVNGAPPAVMKTVCSWCGTVICDGPEEPPSHGICPKCYKTFEKEYRPEPEPEIYPQDSLEYLGSLWKSFFTFSLVFNIAWMVIVLASAVLHWLTGGYTPDLLRWLVDWKPPGIR